MSFENVEPPVPLSELLPPEVQTIAVYSAQMLRDRHFVPPVIDANCTYHLFQIEDRDPDIRIQLLGVTWHMHKQKLSQCRYFDTMFSGCWRESCSEEIVIEAVDEHFTADALMQVFGYLHFRYLRLVPQNYVDIMVVAMYFQVDKIVDDVERFVIANWAVHNAAEIYELSATYGNVSLQRFAYNWLLLNFTSQALENHALLRHASMPLVLRLLHDAELIVLPGEYVLYAILRTYMYLQLVTERRARDCNQLTIRTYFQSRMSSGGDSIGFLDTEAGKVYAELFKCLRLKYIVLNEMELRTLYQDRILPPAWIQFHVSERWIHMLDVEQQQVQPVPAASTSARASTSASASTSARASTSASATSNVPGTSNVPAEIDEAHFSAHCMRSAMIFTMQRSRFLVRSILHGALLLELNGMSYMMIRRMISHTGFPQNHPRLMLRIRAHSMDENRATWHQQRTQLVTLTLPEGEAVELASLDYQMRFPIALSLELLNVRPNELYENQYDVQQISSTLENSLRIGMGEAPSHEGERIDDIDSSDD